MPTPPKRLCIISSHTDAHQVGELVKRLRPLLDRNALDLWYPEGVVPGISTEESLEAFLPTANALLICISPELWNEGELYTWLQQRISLLQPNTAVYPLLARHHSVWESDDFLGSHAANLLPSGRQPLPTDDPEHSDAWFSQVAGEIASKLGLFVPRQAASRPVWKKTGFWASFLAAAALLVAVLAYLNDLGVFPFRTSQAAAITRADAIPPVNTDTSIFPVHFDSTRLYVLITRFEDDANENETGCYGLSIERRIDIIRNRENLPVVPKYVHTLSPNQSDEAARLREFHHADLIVWGKLRNATNDCRADGFCLNYLPSDTLIRYAGGVVPKKVDNEYLPNISSYMLEDGLISLGGESFDAWIISMSNLKVGKIKPEFYRIAADWPVEKQMAEYGKRANMFFLLGLFDKTIQDYTAAIRLKPSTLCYYKRGVAFAKMSRQEEAIADFSKAAALNPEDANIYYNRAKSYRILGYEEMAISDFSEAVRLDPGFADAFYFRGNVLRDQQKDSAAIADYDRVIQLKPGHVDAYINRGISNGRLGRYEAALADYDKAISLDSSQSNAYNNRGTAAYDLGKIKESIADYDKALRLKPDHIEALYNRALAKNQLKQYASAMEDLDKAIQLKPAYQNAYFARGETKRLLGQFEAAVKDYDKSIETTPSFASAYLARGMAEDNLGHYEAAVRDYSKSLELKPNVAGTYIYRGDALGKLKRYEAAIQDYTKAIELEPKNDEAYVSRALALKELKNDEAALADYNKAVEVQPDQISPYLNRAAYYRQVGQKERAIADYNKAIQIQPDYAIAYYNRALVHGDMGHPELELADYSKTIELKPDNTDAYLNRGYLNNKAGDRKSVV